MVHRKVTAEEIDLFQDHIDDFFDIWGQLFG